MKPFSGAGNSGEENSHFWGGEAQTSNLPGNEIHLSTRSCPLAVPFPQGWWLCPGLHLSAAGTCSWCIFVLLFSTPIFPAQIFLWPFFSLSSLHRQ